MTKSKLRMLLGVLAVFAALTVAVACGDDDNGGKTATTAPSGGTSTSGSPSASTETKASGTITIVATQFESWDPHFADFAQDIAHFYMVWRGLYEFDLNGKPIPSMADGMPEVTNDGKTYTVKIKKDLKWSNGDPLDADDFVMGLLRTCNPDNAGQYESLISELVGCDDYYAAADADATKKEELRKAVGVKKIDDHTVEFNLTDPVPTFTTKLATWVAMPVDSKKLTTPDAKWLDPVDNIYNGPYMPTEYTEKDHMTLVPNPNWSGATKPQVAKIVLRYIDDLSVANNAYRNGEVDATRVNLTELDTVQKDSTLSKELLEWPATRTIGMEFNLNDPLMKNTDFRVALSRSVDRDELNKIANKGANVPTTSWMPAEDSGVKEGTYDSLLGFDLDAAKAALQKSGIDPKNATFTLLLTDTPTNHADGEYLQQAWKKNLGIDIKLEFVDSKTRSTRYNKLDYQVVLGGWQEDYADPENWMLLLWLSSSTINKTATNVPALDDLLKKAQFNQNDEQRRQQYRDAEKVLLDGANGIAPLWHTGNHVLIKPYIKGMAESKRPGDTFVAGDWNPENWSTTKK